MSRLINLLQIDAERRPLRVPSVDSLPFRLEPAGARVAVLLLHGFTGRPTEMRLLGDALAEAGYAVSCPRYPGHGSSRRDFFLTGADDWVRSAFDAYLDLRARYETVYVMGHSMGGCIASAVAIAFDAPRLVLLAPAFEISTPGFRLTPFIAPFVRVIRRGRAASAFDLESPERTALHADYWADDLVRPAAELLRVSNACRKNLKRLRARTLVLVGEGDRTVPTSVVERIRSIAPEAAHIDSRILSGATHCFPFNDRADETIKLVLGWLKGDSID